MKQRGKKRAEVQRLLEKQDILWVSTVRFFYLDLCKLLVAVSRELNSK